MMTVKKSKRVVPARRPTVDSDPKIYWTGDEQAYRALKWFKADAVRLIRAALDNGVPLEKLLASAEGVNADMVQAAMRYMAANPKTGNIRWIDGHEWDWVPDGTPH